MALFWMQVNLSLLCVIMFLSWTVVADHATIDIHVEFNTTKSCNVSKVVYEGETVNLRVDSPYYINNGWCEQVNKNQRVKKIADFIGKTSERRLNITKAHNGIWNCTFLGLTNIPTSGKRIIRMGKTYIPYYCLMELQIFDKKSKDNKVQNNAHLLLYSTIGGCLAFLLIVSQCAALFYYMRKARYSSPPERSIKKDTKKEESDIYESLEEVIQSSKALIKTDSAQHARPRLPTPTETPQEEEIPLYMDMEGAKEIDNSMPTVTPSPKPKNLNPEEEMPVYMDMEGEKDTDMPIEAPSLPPRNPKHIFPKFKGLKAVKNHDASNLQKKKDSKARNNTFNHHSGNDIQPGSSSKLPVVMMSELKEMLLKQRQTQLVELGKKENIISQPSTGAKKKTSAPVPLPTPLSMPKPEIKGIQSLISRQAQSKPMPLPKPRVLPPVAAKPSFKGELFKKDSKKISDTILANHVKNCQRESTGEIKEARRPHALQDNSSDEEWTYEPLKNFNIYNV